MQTQVRTKYWGRGFLYVAFGMAILLGVLSTPFTGAAQTLAGEKDKLAFPIIPIATPAPKPGQTPVDVAADQSPLTDREKAMLEMIKGLQERLTKLEAQVGIAAEKPKPPDDTVPVPAKPPTPDPVVAQDVKQDEDEEDSRLKKGVPIAHATTEFEPGEGFQIGKTKLGSLNISGYLVARYLNQTGPDTYVDHLGRTQTVKTRQDFQFHRAMLYFQGYFLNPKLYYNITLWTVNDTDQKAIIGGISYAFNKHFIVGAGWYGLPGTRSMHGSHPYWPSYDRVMADEFFRPYFTQGVKVQGDIVKGLTYEFVVGNNSSSLGVAATKLDRHLSYGASLTWRPTTGEFGPRAAFGDFENHDKLASQFGFAYTNSREQRFSENNTKPDNTTIRLADSLNVFDIDAFANGTTVSQVDYQLFSSDIGFKYKGFWIQAEGYYRILDNFVADGPMPLRTLQDKGFYIQASYMVVPKTVELYGATSKVFSQMGRPWEVLAGTNYYPFENRNFRFNVHVVNVNKSPVSSTFGYYVGGLKGWSMTVGSSVLF